MQKVTKRQGKQWSKEVFDQEFSNFLVEVDSKHEVELKIPEEYAKKSIAADHNGVSFAPHGERVCVYIIYRGVHMCVKHASFESLY
jgi:hypothetical protein